MNVFKKKRLSKRGQIWIETVLYILIAFALIAAVLAFVKPKIQEIQDKTITVQSISVMEEINSLVTDVVVGGAGNKRTLQLKIEKGNLEIDGTNEKIVFEIESKYQYSQLNSNVRVGSINITTEEIGSKLYKVVLTLDYLGRYDIAYGDDSQKIYTIAKSPTEYRLFISNKGNNKINFEVE